MADEAAAPKVSFLQLALRFGLELGSLLAIGTWGFRIVGGGAVGWVLGLGLVGLASAAWATFAVPGDASRSGKAPVPVSGAVRLVIELAFFLAGAAAMVAIGRWQAAAIYVAAMVLHHLMTTPRLKWLLAQKRQSSRQ